MHSSVYIRKCAVVIGHWLKFNTGGVINWCSGLTFWLGLWLCRFDGSLLPSFPVQERHWWFGHRIGTIQWPRGSGNLVSPN